MSEEEKIDIKKAVKGVITPVNYIKAGVFTMNIGVVLAIGIGIYTVFGWLFPKKQNQNQETNIVIEKGAHVERLITSNKQNGDKKGTGIEISGSSNDAGILFKKYLNDRSYAGIGVRWDYDHDAEDSGVRPEVRVGVDF